MYSICLKRIPLHETKSVYNCQMYSIAPNITSKNISLSLLPHAKCQTMSEIRSGRTGAKVSTLG